LAVIGAFATLMSPKMQGLGVRFWSKNGKGSLNRIFYTHDHADQSHGIDDLRAIAYRMQKQIPTYMDTYTKTHVFNRFKYCFEMPEGRVHPPILTLEDFIEDGSKTRISGPGGDIVIDTFEISHGPTPALGFLMDGKLAYSPDVWGINDDILKRLDKVVACESQSQIRSPHKSTYRYGLRDISQ